MRTLSLLGATGSIGRQTLDIVRSAPDKFTVAALTARSNADALFDLIREFHPAVAALAVFFMGRKMTGKKLERPEAGTSAGA